VANLGSGDVSVLLGKGDGTFRVAVSYPVGPELWSVAVGDFNGDGRPDLAVANSVADVVSVLLGNGDGTFQDAANYRTGNGPVSVHVSDFDGDGKPDLAVASRNSDTVSVLLNTCGVVEIGLVIVPSNSSVI